MKSGLLFCMLLFSTPLIADNLPDEPLIDYIETRIESGEYVGMIVGFVDADKTFVQAFGSKNSSANSPPDENTIFEISSISKTFAATLLAVSVIDGEIALSDSANDHLWPGISFADYENRAITMLDLASHQSGLPYLPKNLLPGQGANPYANTDVDDLTRSINAFVPETSAGTGYSYSAFAYGTIAHIISKRQGATFKDLVKREITAPLGMLDTVMHLDSNQSERLATGYTPEGEPAPPLDQGIFEAAGSMYSSLHDLMIWLNANMGRIESPIEDAIALTHPLRNDLGTIGLAWHQSDGHTDRSQFGTAHGYRAYIGFLADGSKGAVVLANTKANVMDIGERLILGTDLPTDE